MYICKCMCMNEYMYICINIYIYICVSEFPFHPGLLHSTLAFSERVPGQPFQRCELSSPVRSNLFQGIAVPVQSGGWHLNAVRSSWGCVGASQDSDTFY